MPNWCSTAYVIEGDAQEIKSLYELMKDLQDRKTPAVKNGFGTSWLGCLVDALGKDWDKVSCRGEAKDKLLCNRLLLSVREILTDAKLCNLMEITT